VSTFYCRYTNIVNKVQVSITVYRQAANKQNTRRTPTEPAHCVTFQISYMLVYTVTIKLDNITDVNSMLYFTRKKQT